jgi:hypothetical protein
MDRQHQLSVGCFPVACLGNADHPDTTFCELCYRLQNDDGISTDPIQFVHQKLIELLQASILKGLAAFGPTTKRDYADNAIVGVHLADREPVDCAESLNLLALSGDRLSLALLVSADS